MKKFPIARRQFLRGLGGFTLGLPFLPSLLPGKAYAQANTYLGPRRFVALTSGHGGVMRSATYPAMPASPMTATVIGDYVVRSAPLVRQLAGSDAFISDIYRAPASEFPAGLVGKMNLLRAITTPWYIAHNTGGMLGNFARNDGNGTDGQAAQAFPTPTIDQLMAYSANFYPNLTGVVRRSVVLGGQGGLSWNWNNPGMRMGNIVEASRLSSPRAAFDALFRATTPSPAPGAPRRAVVDLVLGEYNQLRQSNRRLSRDDRDRLDAHIARLDDLQRRVGGPVGGGGGSTGGGGGSSTGGGGGGSTGGGGGSTGGGGGSTGGGGGMPVGGGGGGATGGGGGSTGGGGGSTPTGIQQCQSLGTPQVNTNVTGAAFANVQHLYNDVVAMAFACGSTRVAVMGTEEYRYEIDAITGDWHQDIAHQWSNAQPQTHLQNANRATFRHAFLDLARKLDAVEDAPGVTVLDNTLLVWLWESGEETHGNTEVPVLMAGGAGGFLRTGQYCDYRDLSPGGLLRQYNQDWSERPGLTQNQFLATCLQAMGVQTSEFNNVPNSGFRLMGSPPPVTGYGFAQIAEPYGGGTNTNGRGNPTRTFDTMSNMNALLPFLRA